MLIYKLLNIKLYLFKFYFSSIYLLLIFYLQGGFQVDYSMLVGILLLNSLENLSVFFLLKRREVGIKQQIL